MPRSEACVGVCVCFLNYKLGGACDHSCACLRCIFACTTVRVRGRCKGFPSVGNEVLYSQRDATKRGREMERKSRGDAGIGGWEDVMEGATMYTVTHFELYVFEISLFPVLTLVSPNRTLNNNNISSIPVSSFNHMPKLRTL